MSPRPHLKLIRRAPIVSDREHDLPPMWDGHPVRWGPWERATPAFMCALNDIGRSEPVPPACQRCGAIQTVDIVATGRVLSSITGPSGQPCDGTPLAALTAVRCGDCGHDTVHNIVAGQTWDLSLADYTDGGSYEQ